MVAFKHIPLWIPAPPDNQQGQNLPFHRFHASFCWVSPKRQQGPFRLAINVTKENTWNTLKLVLVVLTSGNTVVEERPFPQARFLCRQMGMQWGHSPSSQALNNNASNNQRSDGASKSQAEQRPHCRQHDVSKGWAESGVFLIQLCCQRGWMPLFTYVRIPQLEVSIPHVTFPTG